MLLNFKQELEQHIDWICNFCLSLPDSLELLIFEDVTNPVHGERNMECSCCVFITTPFGRLMLQTLPLC